MKTHEFACGDHTPTGYISAGGRGTRLNELFTPDPSTGIAKALLEIGNPKTRLIDHHIANLRQQNIERIVVAAGDQHNVYEYIQDTYADDPAIIATKSLSQLGTGGDLVEYARTSDASFPLLVQNVDTILDIDLLAFADQFVTQRRLGAMASIALTLKKGVPNEGAFQVDCEGKVLYSAEFDDSKNMQTQKVNTHRASSTGAVVIDMDFLRDQKWQKQDGQISLYKNCLYDAWRQDGLYAYNNECRFFRDVGTVAMWLDSRSSLEIQAQLRYS